MYVDNTDPARPVTPCRRRFGTPSRRCYGESVGFIIVSMLVIVVVAVLVVTFVAFPHRGEEVPGAPGSGDDEPCRRRPATIADGDLDAAASTPGTRQGTDSGPKHV